MSPTVKQESHPDDRSEAVYFPDREVRRSTILARLLNAIPHAKESRRLDHVLTGCSISPCAGFVPRAGGD